MQVGLGLIWTAVFLPLMAPVSVGSRAFPCLFFLVNAMAETLANAPNIVGILLVKRRWGRDLPPDRNWFRDSDTMGRSPRPDIVITNDVITYLNFRTLCSNKYSDRKSKQENCNCSDCACAWQLQQLQDQSEPVHHDVMVYSLPDYRNGNWFVEANMTIN